MSGLRQIGNTKTYNFRNTTNSLLNEQSISYKNEKLLKPKVNEPNKH